MAKKKKVAANRLEDTAETLGRVLGTVAAQFDHWRKQRAELTDQLSKIVDSAQSMLRELRTEGERGWSAARKAAGAARKASGAKGRGRKTGARKRRKLSAEARRKMSLAAKKRWAARKAAQAGK